MAASWVVGAGGRARTTEVSVRPAAALAAGPAARRAAVLAGLGMVLACAPPAAAQQTAPAASVWDGVFTEAQARRGEAIYDGACSFCHGRRLDGAPDDPDMRSTPPLARARFLREWEGRSLSALLAYTRDTMPEDNPNSLTAQEYLDVIAYMLEVTGTPTGDAELEEDPDRLTGIAIQSDPTSVPDP